MDLSKVRVTGAGYVYQVDAEDDLSLSPQQIDFAILTALYWSEVQGMRRRSCDVIPFPVAMGAQGECAAEAHPGEPDDTPPQDGGRTRHHSGDAPTTNGTPTTTS